MAKFITLGCYTAKGFTGFVSNPSTDRKADMVAVSSGAVSDFTILEDVNLNDIAKTANKMVSAYKEPGK